MTEDRKKRRSLTKIFHGKKFGGYHPGEDATAIDPKPPKGGSGFVPQVKETESEEEHEASAKRNETS